MDARTPIPPDPAPTTSVMPRPPARRQRRAPRLLWALAGLLTGLLPLLGGGCASLPQEVASAPTWTLAPDAASPLARLVDASTPAAERHRSGFGLIADGADALATRLALIRGAQLTLDLQYFLVADDASGELLLQELDAAARRGVRVRLLVDDLHAGALEDRLAALARRPQAEVRLFNPLPVRGASLLQRVLGSLHEFQRINRRMHNKLLVADGRIALAGGRNIGDDYFMRGTVANFVDLDILCTGAVVGELADLFDRFWNDPLAYPVHDLVAPGPAPVAVAAAAAPAAVPDGWAAQVAGGRLVLRFADVRVFADLPEKAEALAADAPGPAMQQALALMRGAEHEVAIVSPYFVPGPIGMALLHEARSRGLDVRVLTNSHGATDEPLAHGGYRRYRPALLKLGVKLAELSPLHAPAPGGYRSSLGRLHAKLAVVDRRWLLVGSLNMDRRSSRLNTEFALAIDSPALAAEALGLVDQLWASGNYQPRLAEADDRIEWVTRRDGRTVVLDREPHLDPVAGWRLQLLSLLVPEEML